MLISYLLLSLAALWIVALFVFQRPSQSRPQLETYYVCDPESLPNPSLHAAPPALVGEPRG